MLGTADEVVDYAKAYLGVKALEGRYAGMEQSIRAACSRLLLQHGPLTRKDVFMLVESWLSHSWGRTDG